MRNLTLFQSALFQSVLLQSDMLSQHDEDKTSHVQHQWHQLELHSKYQYCDQGREGRGLPWPWRRSLQLQETFRQVKYSQLYMWKILRIQVKDSQRYMWKICWKFNRCSALCSFFNTLGTVYCNSGFESLAQNILKTRWGKLERRKSCYIGDFSGQETAGVRWKKAEAPGRLPGDFEMLKEKRCSGDIGRGTTNNCEILMQPWLYISPGR